MSANANETVSRIITRLQGVTLDKKQADAIHDAVTMHTIYDPDPILPAAGPTPPADAAEPPHRNDRWIEIPPSIALRGGIQFERKGQVVPDNSEFMRLIDHDIDTWLYDRIQARWKKRFLGQWKDEY